MGISPHHVGLTVEDIDRAKAWYADAFGFAPQLEFELPAGVRGAMLRTEDGARIELFEVPGSEPGLKRADPPLAMRTTGFGHVGLESSDLDAAFAQATAAGGVAVWEPRQSPEPGLRMAFVHDPDGNLIELIGV